MHVFPFCPPLFGNEASRERNAFLEDRIPFTVYGGIRGMLGGIHPPHKRKKEPQASLSRLDLPASPARPVPFSAVQHSLL